MSRVREDPATYQGLCDQCGWHTVPLANEKRAKHYAEQHEKVCPSPPPPRSGATAECGCWWHAMPGSHAGETRAECPRHGDVLVVACNVAEPAGEALTAQWTLRSPNPPEETR